MILLKKCMQFLRSHLLLIVTGSLCELFYLFYFLRQFPLLSHYQALADMGYMQDHSQASFAMFLIVMTVLFALFGLAWWQTYTNRDQATLRLILGFGMLFAGTMIFVYPMTAIDVFAYVIQSLILVQYHANPMVTPASQFSYDSMAYLAGGWAGTPSPYGPLGILIDAIPTALVGRNLLANLLLLKFLFSASMLVEAFLVYKILSHYAPQFALAGCLFIAWNPHILFEYSANSHNDIILMLFVTLAVLALLKNHPALACSLIIASVLVKYVTLPLLPLFFIYTIRQLPTAMMRVRYALLVLLVSSLLIVGILLPFWAGPTMFLSVIHADNLYMASFATVLYDTSATRISLDQGKLIGRLIFSCFYVYALFLSTKSLPDMLRGCFLALFFFVAFAASKFEIWYAIWPVLLAVLVPRKEQSLAAFLLTYGASISVTLYVYVWVWLGLNDDTIAVVHVMAYLISFAPALLLLFGSALKQFSVMQSKLLTSINTP